ncbi:hypothetical protein [Leptospira bandrabouensis]|uniref:C1q domain-containing protein n=1 Tax=Leptospira bandrabouensis TaxID=2484903 RepID=A0A6H3NTK4_9LEPT|nr:hypothetical protein [Leptospira bandrabouensis]TGN09978.1 hypothetical protein EHR07_00430 [Leptospira bandrabouensis]TGN12364.1 hypothetical protein EHR08_13360 [Leptospira bandrabouensis]
MALSVTLNEINYSIPEEQETGYGLTLTTYLSDLADYLQNGYLGNVSVRLKLFTNDSTGTINNLNTNNQSFIRLTDATKITGIGNVQIGKIVHLINASSIDIEITNEDELSELNNQIITTDNQSFFLVPNGIVSFYYDSSETKWRLINSNSLLAEKYAVDDSSGVITDLNTINRTFIRLTQATEVRSLSNPVSGKRILILNDTGSTIFLRNENGDSTANNRIETSNGYDYVLLNGYSAQLTYNEGSQRWIVLTNDSIRRDKIEVITTSGIINNLDISRVAVVKLTQATELTGLNSNEEGRELVIFNDNTTPLTIKNESTDSTASNRIQTDTNSDVTIRQYGTVILKYDTVSSRWRIKSRTIDNSEYDDTYQLRSEKGVANGYASLDVSGTVPVNQIDLSFFDLNDVTATTFVGQKTKVVKVNNSETGLELGLANNSSNNYIQFPTAIYSDPLTLGWEVYNDGATPPIDGQGGTPTITLDYRNGALGGIIYEDLNGEGSSAPSDWYVLRGSNGTGEGASYPFTIQANHRASILEISFDYYFRFDGIPGFTINADVRCYIIDDYTGEVIQPSNLYIVQPPNYAGSNNLNIPRKYIGTFQTSLTSQNYRLCIHVANSLGSRSLFFKNVKIWNQEKNYGAIITDWQTYTPVTQGLGTISNSSLRWRRVGTNLEIRGNFRTGTVNTDELRIGLPNGYVIETPITASADVEVCGYMSRDASTILSNMAVLSKNGQNYLTVGFIGSDVNRNPMASVTGNGALGSSEDISLYASVPITGWGGTVQLSSQVGDGRSVVARYSTLSGTTALSGSTLVYVNKQFDSHNGYNTSTGVYTIPESGVYLIQCADYFTASGNGIDIYVNGVIYRKYASYGTSAYSNNSVDLISCNSGDQITCRVASGTLSTNGGTPVQFFSIAKLNSGNQAFAREESVGCEAYCATNRTIDSSTNLRWDTVTKDTHGAMNTTTGVYTAPQNGWYSLTGYIQPTSSNSGFINIYKNGSLYKAICFLHSTYSNPGFSTIIYLLSGDTLSIRSNSSFTATGGTLSTASTANISIFKIGN